MLARINMMALRYYPPKAQRLSKFKEETALWAQITRILSD
jgi:hypothetical protein